ncbi:MAG: CvpA family protein [Clostridiales bacterium]|nr:CvpA family protein [Clostridiales bacterium]
MGSSFWWFYDAIIITLIFGLIYRNAKKGFVKSIMLIATYAIAVSLSLPISSLISNKIYDRHIREKSIEAVESTVTNFRIEREIKNIIDQSNFGVEISEQEINEILSSTSDLTADEQIMGLIRAKAGQGITRDNGFKDSLENNISNRITSRLGDEIPSFVARSVAETTTKNKELFSDTVKVLASSPSESANFIEANYLKPVTVNVIRIVVFLILFTICSVVLSIVLVRLDKIATSAGVSKYDGLLGGIIGFVEAMIFIILVVFLVKLLITISDGTLVFFNNDTIERTKIFRLFYNLKIMGYSYPV